MKAIDWSAVRAATPASVTCNHCGRPDIVVDKTTGLRAPHRIERKTRPGQKSPWCDGGDRLHTSTPQDKEPAVPDTQIEREQLVRAALLVVDSQFSSPSFLSRKFGITWAEAQELLRQLEERGVVGPAEGTQQRMVLAQPGELDDLLEHLRGEA